MADSDFRENAALASKSLSEGKRPASKIAEIVWQASHAELASASAKQDYEK